MERAAEIVGLFSVLGMLVDFYIGKVGQQRLREWLESLWIKFADVNVASIASKEAAFSVRCIEFAFGARAFSLHRVAAIATVEALTFLFRYEEWLSRVGYGATFSNPLDPRDVAPTVLLSMIRVSLSISISLLLARFIKSRLYDYRFVSFSFLGFIILVQVTLMAAPELSFYAKFYPQDLNYTSPLTDTISEEQGFIFLYLKNVVFKISDRSMFSLVPAFISRLIFQPLVLVDGIWLSIRNFIATCVLVMPWNTACFGISQGWDPEELSRKTAQCSEYLVALSRLAMFLCFLIGVLLKPVHVAITTFWLRAIETEKPLFTLLFGGLSTLIQSVQLLRKLL